MSEAITAQGGADWDNLGARGANEADLFANGVNPQLFVHPDMTLSGADGDLPESETQYNRRILALGSALPVMGTTSARAIQETATERPIISDSIRPDFS